MVELDPIERDKNMGPNGTKQTDRGTATLALSLPSTDRVAECEELVVRKRLGESVALLLIGRNELENDGIGMKMRSKPMILDGEGLGTRRETRRIGGCKDGTGLIVFHNGGNGRETG